MKDQLPRIMDFKTATAIFLIWLLHLSAIIGVLSGEAGWFIPKTPWNLLVCTGLLIWVFPLDTLRKVGLFGFIFAAGIGAEWIGVHTGALFGTYSYGANLGPKLDGVPYLIGANWAVLSFCSGAVSNSWALPRGARVLFGGLLMLGLDYFMEGLAPAFDFWEFQGGEPPLYNYVCWFGLALLFQGGFQGLRLEGNRSFSAHLLAAQFTFFIALSGYSPTIP
jgi:putative membrane protein